MSLCTLERRRSSRSVDVGDEQVSWRVVPANRVDHSSERSIERDAVQPARACRDLLHTAVRHRHAKHVVLAANRRAEVEKPAVGRPARRPRVEIPARGQIDRLATRHRPDIQVLGAAMIQLLLDDHVGAQRPRVGQIPAVRRVAHVTINVAVVRDSIDFPVEGDGPQVRRGVFQFVAPIRVGCEGDQLSIRVPRDVRRPKIVVDDDPRHRLVGAGSNRDRLRRQSRRPRRNSAPSRWKSSRTSRP